MDTAQEQFNVGGMSCSFCAESIRKAYARTEGVEDVDVSLAHEEVLVQYDDEVIGEVELKDTLRDLGYTVRDPDKAKQYEEQQAELAAGKRRLLLAGAAAIVTAGLMVWMVFVAGRFESESLVMDALALGLAFGTMFGPGRYIKAKAYHSLRRGILNQHVLLEAGAFAGLLGGFLGLFVFPGFPTVHFFAVSVFITTYHILSEYTSLVVRTRASQAVQGLLDLQPDTARRVREGETGSASERSSGGPASEASGTSSDHGSDGERSDPRDGEDDLAAALADARQDELAETISSAGLYNQKSETLIRLAGRVREEYGGGDGFDEFVADGDPNAVRDALLEMKGVGPKTADCVMLFAGGQSGVFPVDTHVHRIARRMGLAPSDADHETVRERLETAVPAEKCGFGHTAMIQFGREYCTARKPACLEDPEACPMADLCDQVGVYPETGEVVDPGEAPGR